MTLTTLAFYLGTKAENPNNSRFIDHLVCWWTDSRFSHVEFVESIDGLTATTWSASQRDGGVRQTTIDLSTGRWVLAGIPADHDMILEWFKDHKGEGYDWLGVMSFVIALIPDHRTHHWYCSKAISAAAGWKYTHHTPQDLWSVGVEIPLPTAAK
jgi:hypothetical protein